MKDFIKQFGDINIDNVKVIQKRYYSSNLDYSEEPEHVGIYLGKMQGKKFIPSIELIDIISKQSSRKLWVDEKGEWLFICGRDLMGQSIEKSNVEKGIVLVQNHTDENLGYGKIIDKLDGKDKIVVKNILDKGFYLRKEK